MIRTEKKSPSCFFLSAFYKSFKFSSPKNGFTMVEIVVMLAIITMLSGIVLFSFKGLNEGGSLNRSAREMALNIRKAQNYSLAVTEIPVGNPSVSTLPPAVGVEFSINKTNYQMFADMDTPAVRDYKYTGSSEQMGNPIDLYSNTKVVGLNTAGGSQAKINIIFTAPESSILITQADGTSVGNKVDIVIQAPTTGQTRTITVRTSGQITIK